MWYLVEEAPAPGESPAPKYWLGGTHPGSRIIGRKNVHIRIKATSVSRTHATIRVVPAARGARGAQPARGTAVELEDSSAYGTYLKYPPGHASNRYGEVQGHHRRLDKRRPMEVQEGALLAFGAPSAWWRLGWCNIVCFAHGLPARQRARLEEVTKNAGLEIADAWGENVTHVIASECKTSSMKFLMAMARGMKVVIPAWAISVQQTVKEACKEITEAQNNETAVSISKLPQEELFIPPFDAADVGRFSEELLADAFSPEVTERRVDLFKSIVFAFTREDARSNWSSVLTILGAETIPVGAMEGRSNVFVFSPDRKSDRVSLGTEATPDLGDDVVFVREIDLIKAILSGDKSHVFSAKPSTKVSKKRRLDGESNAAKRVVEDEDGLSEENVTNGHDVGSPKRKAKKSKNGPGRQSPGQSNVNGREVKTEDCLIEDGDDTRENMQLSDEQREDEQSNGNGRAVKQEDFLVDAENSGENKEVSEEQREAANNRKFFAVRPAESPEKRAERPSLSEHDVRRFRRKSLPREAKVSLKRARYMQDDTKIPHRSYDRGAAKESSGEDEDGS